MERQNKFIRSLRRKLEVECITITDVYGLTNNATYLGFSSRDIGKILFDLSQLVAEKLQGMIIYRSLLIGRLRGRPHLFLRHRQFSVVTRPQHLALNETLLELLDLPTTFQGGYLLAGNVVKWVKTSDR